MPVTSGQRFWHQAANEGARQQQQAEERNASARQSKNRDDRNFNKAVGGLKDSYDQAINNANNTRDKRRLKRERDQRVDKAISDREAADNPTDRNTTTEDDSTDSTGSYPDNGANGAPGGGEGGGLPDAFLEETLDIVDSNNLAAQRIFLTKDVV